MDRSSNRKKTSQSNDPVRSRVSEGYNDDDDVVYNSEESLIKDEGNEDDEEEDENADRVSCRMCKSRVNLIKEGCSTPSSLSCNALICLDLVCFNYAREIYFYENSPIREHVSQA